MYKDLFKAYKDKIPGGLADNKQPSEFDQKALKEGVSVEKEHTSNPGTAKEIAMDHLTEDKKYYKKLAVMEKGANGDWKKEGYNFKFHKPDIQMFNGAHDITEHRITAHDSAGNHVGDYRFSEWPEASKHKGLLHVTYSGTDPDHRRKGLASEAYRIIEQKTGKRLHSSNNNRSDDAKALWSQKNRNFGKTEDLEKGAMKRLAPFKPTDLPMDTRENMEIWQDDQPVETRDQLAAEGMDSNAKMRALHKLSGRTAVRKDKNGKREFLLHRGMSTREFLNNRNPGNTTRMDHKESTSWTPNLQTAQEFKGIYGEDDQHKFSKNKPSGIVSAWVNEDHISFVPKQYGSMSTEDTKPGKNKFSGEHEIIVSGNHNSEMVHKKHLPNLIGQKKDNPGMVTVPTSIDQQINRRARVGSTPNEEVAHEYAQVRGRAAKSEQTLEKGAQGDYKKEGYTIEHHPHPDESLLVIHAKDKNGNKVGKATFTHYFKDYKTGSEIASKTHIRPYHEHDDKNEATPAVKVHRDHQRKGLASAMYAHAEKISKKKIVDIGPENRTSSGRAFWKQPQRNFGKAEYFGLMKAMFKSNYGPKGGGQYTQADNVRRKQGNANEVITAPGNVKIKTGANASGSQGKQKLNTEMKELAAKNRKQPVKTFSPEEKAALAEKMGFKKSELNKSNYFGLMKAMKVKNIKQTKNKVMDPMVPRRRNRYPWYDKSQARYRQAFHNPEAGAGKTHPMRDSEFKDMLNLEPLNKTSQKETKNS